MLYGQGVLDDCADTSTMYMIKLDKKMEIEELHQSLKKEKYMKNETLTIQTTGLSLLEIRDKYRDLFYSQEWYDKEQFAAEKPVAGEYEFDFISKHTSLNYEEQKGKLPKGFEFPHPAVLAEALCIHFKNTGERLLEDWYSRTSLRDSGGFRVYVGNFDSGGLVVSAYWDDGRDSHFGVASARKLEPGTFESSSSDPLSPESLSARIKNLEEFEEKVRKFLIL